MEIYAKIYLTYLFSFFVFLITILSYKLILHASQLQTQQLMTSQIISLIEYLVQKI